ncbi:MAG: hypothetical protein JSV82_01015 [Planctomycetota bacterium]|nr:MAG: hypothetical protein JSV82_01015 [Planctomycetota bacterium]
MQILGENLWITILFWLVIIIIIALLIFCCVSHFIKKGEEQEEERPWYSAKLMLRAESYCTANAELMQQAAFVEL